MKEIKAFIHRNRVADVLHALKNNNFCAGHCHLSINDVAGSLQALDNSEQTYSIELGEHTITEIKLELICEDARATEAVALIRDNARTGQPLAGWIYMTPIAEAIPIEDLGSPD
ncbi:MAG TPA: P-II family nitrogen regulator [Gammaproteobacteria bacterium]|nr:P-II family nitrogen regulator [Gammaproteobacteria bacterium]